MTTIPVSVRARPLTLAPDLTLALGAIGIRLSLIVFALIVSHQSIAQLAAVRDGLSYTHVAQAMLGQTDALTTFDRRAFPGYPALIAVVSALHVSTAVAGLAISCVAAAATAVFTAKVFGRRVGWAIAIFPPSFLTYSSLVMTEAPLLALTMIGVYLTLRDKDARGGVTLGLAGLVRPVACFAVLGLMVVRRRLTVGVVALLVVVAGMGALAWWQGSALEGVRIYASDPNAFNGHLLGWPFESLILTPFRIHVPLWKVAYVWTYVLFTFGGLTLLVMQRRELLTDLSLVWLASNTFFVLCVGHIWGFHDFNRHILASLPPLLYAYEPIFPKRKRSLVLIGALSWTLGLVGILRS